jgi:hypothetical protein
MNLIVHAIAKNKNMDTVYVGKRIVDGEVVKGDFFRSITDEGNIEYYIATMIKSENGSFYNQYSLCYPNSIKLISLFVNEVE